MADNATGVGAASVSYTFATDEVGGVHYPRYKLTWGIDGTVVDASGINPLPVVQTGTHTVELGSTTLTALETIELGSTTLAALETISATVTGSVSMTGALPAGTAYLGQQGAELSTSAIRDGSTSLTPKFAAISAASSGDNTAVAAVTSKKIRVLSYSLVADGAVTARFQSDTTDLTGAMSFAENGGISCAFSPVGHFETAAGVALQLNLGGAVGVRGHLTYVEV